jgi:hypothetical protein
MRLLFSTSIGTQEDADWPKVFATSPFISPLALLIFRACSAATFLGHMLAHIGCLPIHCNVFQCNYLLCVWKTYVFVSQTYFGRNPLSLWLYSFAYSLNADGWAYRRVPWSDRALLSKQMSLLSGHWWYRGWAYCIYLTNWALMLQTSSEFWLWKKRPSIIWCFGEENPRPAQLNVWFCWYSISMYFSMSLNCNFR